MQREIPLGGRSDALDQMPVDQPLHRESLCQDVPCQGCGATFGARVWQIRCGRCAGLPFPRLTVFARCPRCGGEARLMAEYRLHVETGHR